MPDDYSPASPGALYALEEYLDSLDHATHEKGRDCFYNKRVKNLVLTEDGFTADVQGGELYQTHLYWDYDDGSWYAYCTCPVEAECKHAAATVLARIAQHGAPGHKPASHAFAIAPAYQQPSSTAKPGKKTFRQQWQPVIEEKLGRRLNEGEASALGRLSALFHVFHQSYGGLSTYQLEHHGFAVSTAAINGPYHTVFDGWWDQRNPPADPWALWQYIAYDWERSGRVIPDVFRPMTDTAAVARSVDDMLTRRELDEWRRALTHSDTQDQPDPELSKALDLRLRLGPQGFFIETVAGPGKPWKAPTQKWVNALAKAGPADFLHLPPAAAALATALAAENDQYSRELSPKFPLTPNILGRILAYTPAHPAITLPDGSPWRIEDGALTPQAVLSEGNARRLDLRLVLPDGTPAEDAKHIASSPTHLYLHNTRIYRGPPPTPARQLPVQALADPALMTRFRAMNLQLPKTLERRLQRITLRPLLRCWLEAKPSFYGEPQQTFHAQLLARSEKPPCAQHWCGHGGWQWIKNQTPPSRGPDDPIHEFDLSAANAVGACFADFKLTWESWQETWTRSTPRDFPEQFLNWRALLPPGLDIEARGELASLVGPPVRAHLDFSALPAPGEHGRDWFDLTVALRVEDTTLGPDEIALLLKARGKWVQLPRAGWRRLEIADSPETRATLGRLGLDAAELDETGKPVVHRLHALQLAGEAAALETRDARLASALRERAAALATVAQPPLPAGLRAELRPYQLEGFHFLAHLSANGLGGILADDMGLGKTVQTLAWLLHLAADPARAAAAPAAKTEPVKASKKPGRPKKSAAAPTVSAPQPETRNAEPETSSPASSAARPFRALVVCPKSVMHGWLSEAERFAPSLATHTFASETAALPAPPGPADAPALLVANYTQLRLNAPWFQQQAWDAVILDEAQFIKNPTSQTAVAARALPTRHRLALTGTPVENRLLDLWSLLAYAQPGLLGTQAAFKRQHRDDDPTAPARLQVRTRHFLLRRTKAQVATDLPPRTEDEIVVELEPAQRKLYDAELKRARAQLLGIETDRALDSVRFNILSSLLRLRQICCHPALIDSAHAELPSAKLDALLERLEELRDEGHQVLVFSQFTTMLELIRDRLVAADIGHLMLTGATENRAELVEKFQTDRTRTVFLLSLKAAGFGLNLTAASYAILYDPWWNPAVEAQAIDRTHRIGQKRPVTAYRLIADETIEQKIRLLQKEKAALAGSIVQEESLASVLDLDSLKKILG